MTVHVLVLGGTGEARRLATALAAQAGTAVTTSLAGAVAAPARPPGAVRVGGFGGAAGLATWLRAHRVTAVVDATHPFAATISAHAVAAAAATGTPLLAVRRPGFRRGPGDRWHRVADARAAAALVPTLGERCFLATGRGDLAVLAGLPVFCLLRAVDPPPPPLPARHHVVLGRGPFGLDDERELLAGHAIDVVVARDSGGDDAKLVAARERGVPVVLIDRPAAPPGPATVATVQEALAWLSTPR